MARGPKAHSDAKPASSDSQTIGKNPHQTSQPSPADSIGERLITYRRTKGLGVSELARMVGVSPSLVSQIERQQSRPSVATLFSLAKALDVSIDAFFSDEEMTGDQARRGAATEHSKPQSTTRSVEWHALKTPTTHRYLVRKDERPSLEIQGGIRWERLTPESLDPLDFLELVYAPGAESNPIPYTHAGLEMVLILEGELEIHVGFDSYKLHPGDSITFPSSIPHRYVNPSQDPARAISVILRDDPT